MSQTEYVIPEKLSHLTQIELSELLTRYYEQNEKIAVLLKDYNIDSTASTFSRHLPKKIHSDKRCPYCNNHGVEQLHSRPSSPRYAHKQDIICPNCKHNLSSSHCNCSSCKQIILDKKRTLINETYGEPNIPPVEYSSLSQLERLYLSVFVRTNFNHNLFLFVPQDVHLPQFKLAPTTLLSAEMLSILEKKHVILVDPSSSPDAFESELFPLQYNPFKVTYRLNLLGTPEETLDHLLHPSLESLGINSPEDLLLIWQHIALHECIEYLDYKMDSVHFNFNAGPKTRLVFAELLNHYSVSQVMNIIYKNISTSTHMYMERSLSKRHAANTVISGCQSFGERAMANKWSITGYRRDFNCPVSTLANIFYNRIAQIGDSGFLEPPNLQTLLGTSVLTCEQ